MARDNPLDYLVIYVLKGAGAVDTEGQRYTVVPGDLLTLKAHESHAYGADPDDPWDILWVHFDGRMAPAFFNALRAYGGVRLALGLDDVVRDRWIELVIAHAAAAPVSRIRDDTALCALLGLLLHRLQVRTLTPEAETPLDVAQLHAYLHHHLAEPITLAGLARQFARSPTHFTRVFRRQFGVSPIYYLIQKRVAFASSLLRETNAPIKQVSASVGYDDPYYFSRLFKQHTGLSPSDYRARRGGARRDITARRRIPAGGR